MKTELLNKKLEELFGLNQLSMHPKSALGAYIPKMNYIFQKRITKINLSLKDGRLFHEAFPSYKRGASQTWYYIFEALYFFGIIENKKYDEQMLLRETVDLDIVKRYGSFAEYLESEESSIRILNNYHNSKKPEWFQNKVFTSIWTHEQGKYGDPNFSPTKNTKNIFTEYKFMYEALATIFTQNVYEMNSVNPNIVRLGNARKKRNTISSERDAEIKIHRAMKAVIDNNVNNIIEDYVDEYIADSFLDGEIKESFVKVRKRNSKLRKLKLMNKGSICEACGLNMQLMYGDLAVPHVHHKVPLYTLDGEKSLTVDDVVVLCPTCHAAIHKRKDPFMTIDEFISVLKSKQKHS